MDAYLECVLRPIKSPTREQLKELIFPRLKITSIHSGIPHELEGYIFSVDENTIIFGDQKKGLNTYYIKDITDIAAVF